MAVIRMLKTYGSNCVGDVCGQPDDVAARLVKTGIAVFVTAAPVDAVVKTVESEVLAEATEDEEPKGLFKKSRKKV